MRKPVRVRKGGSRVVSLADQKKPNADAKKPKPKPKPKSKED